MSSSLLLTKLYRLAVPIKHVLRSLLVDRLNEGLAVGRQLTLVSAPLGFGKTVCVSEWIDTVDLPTTWLSLDTTDDDPLRFFTYFLAALQTVDDRLGEGMVVWSYATFPVFAARCGGFIPAFTGVIAGAAGTQINGLLTWWRSHLSRGLLNSLANLLPWIMLAYFFWLGAQWLLGNFAKESMLGLVGWSVLLGLMLQMSAVVCALAYDIKITLNRKMEANNDAVRSVFISGSASR